MSINIGDKIPSFSLVSNNKENMSDEDFLGNKTSFVFIPFPFSSVCDKEVCELRDNFSNNSDAPDTVIITVCARPTNDAWVKHYNLEYPVLADFWPHGEVSKKFGCFNDQVGISMRVTYITDENNVVTNIIKTDEIIEPRNIEDYKEAYSS
jgi:peroxiredoxin